MEPLKSWLIDLLAHPFLNFCLFIHTVQTVFAILIEHFRTGTASLVEDELSHVGVLHPGIKSLQENSSCRL